ncbi:hypothetical protein SAMN05216244_0237 [Sediminibacillus halophilus]|uniref:Uncharacterized protein n=1 Tax=Sediminibacillus halophilus TaxID=482461 RepID=A0A1G9LQ01_9BACI|nr:hypothetical protein SAMN05216244_0237 [Sediminibacillus halophilus]
MCQHFKDHIHLNTAKEKQSYSTTCQECFQEILKNPDILKSINQAN